MKFAMSSSPHIRTSDNTRRIMGDVLIALIPTLVAHWRKGAEVVLAQRSSRACDPWLKRVTAKAYYRIHNRLSDLKLPENVGDFRLMDRVVVNAIKQLPERTANKKKLGFPVPLNDWLREDKYYNKVKAAFQSNIAEKFFVTDELLRLLDDHKNGRALNMQKIWSFYTFIVWYEQFFVLN